MTLLQFDTLEWETTSGFRAAECILLPRRPIPDTLKAPPSFRLIISHHIGRYFKGHHPGCASKGQRETLWPRFDLFEMIYSKCHLALPLPRLLDSPGVGPRFTRWIYLWADENGKTVELQRQESHTSCPNQSH